VVQQLRGVGHDLRQGYHGGDHGDIITLNLEYQWAYNTALLMSTETKLGKKIDDGRDVPATREAELDNKIVPSHYPACRKSSTFL
jgi:hypothetical protein